MAMKDTCWIWE